MTKQEAVERLETIRNEAAHLREDLQKIQVQLNNAAAVELKLTGFIEGWDAGEKERDAFERGKEDWESVAHEFPMDLEPKQ